MNVSINKSNDFSVLIRDDVKEAAYITFTELNGRTYDINIDEKDGNASLGITFCILIEKLWL